MYHYTFKLLCGHAFKAILPKRITTKLAALLGWSYCEECGMTAVVASIKLL